jgi:TM2 domain-containing membrane protein YozV
MTDFIFMMRLFLFLIVFFVAGSYSSFADNVGFDSQQNLENKLTNYLSLVESDSSKTAEPTIKENKKLMALAINLSLGMLGAHRLYLGTKPHVPVFYLLTFGGVFFILPIIDFFVLTFSKDITPYLNNDKIIMWLKP